LSKLTDSSITGRVSGTHLALTGAGNKGGSVTEPTRSGIRWDGDVNDQGVENGLWIAPDVNALLAELASPGWIAEEPEVHLQPHLRDACEAAGSPWILRQSGLTGTVFTVSLEWTRHAGNLRQLRADAFALLGSFAESTSFVRQCVTDDAVEFRCTTGMLGGDTSFASHGHLVLFRIDGPAVTALRSRHE